MNLYQIRFFSILLFCSLALLYSCDKEPTPELPDPIDYGYVSTIEEPALNNSFQVGDTLPILVHFLSTTSEIVHYISVDIYSQVDPSLRLYSVESHLHVPGSFDYSDTLKLTDTTKIATSKDWILRTSMWSHEIEAEKFSSYRNITVE